MASPTAARIYRELVREFKLIHPKANLNDVPAFNYMTSQFKKFTVTSKLVCRGDFEVEYLADTYRCMLQSTRKYQELMAIYGGKGDRTVEESANLVGLTLPKV